MAWLLGRYSPVYASNQYRALQQFFKCLAAGDQLPDPMAGLAPPRVQAKLVPVFTDEELTRLERVCAGRGFAQRRDTAHHFSHTWLDRGGPEGNLMELNGWTSPYPATPGTRRRPRRRRSQQDSGQDL